MCVLVIVAETVSNRPFISIANSCGRIRRVFHLVLIHWGIFTRKVSLFLHELVLCLVDQLIPKLVTIGH